LEEHHHLALEEHRRPLLEEALEEHRRPLLEEALEEHRQPLKDPWEALHPLKDPLVGLAQSYQLAQNPP
jgi:hypothetical protein